jgi:hypothetical protein
MNDYEAMLRLKSDREQSLRNLRHAQWVEEATRIEKAQPSRLRFHLRLPQISFRLRRQSPSAPPCEPLTAR